MFNVYGQRYKPYDPFLDKNGNVLDDGVPTKIKLASWPDKNMADNFAANVKANVPKRSWNITVEEIL